MPFVQQVEAQEGLFYTGQQIEATPPNAVIIFVTEIDVLPGEIQVTSESAVAISTTPLVFNAPANAELIVGLTINGVYTEDFVYDRVAGTITVNI